LATEYGEAEKEEEEEEEEEEDGSWVPVVLLAPWVAVGVLVRPGVECPYWPPRPTRS
jgi:hypothetical protein